MLVYGDPGYEQSFAVLLEQLRERVLSARQREANAIGLFDALRGLLIFAGQVEQAACDDLPALVAAGQMQAGDAQALLDLVAAVLHQAAAAFMVEWPEKGSAANGVRQSARPFLDSAAKMLNGEPDLPFPAPPPVPVRVKLPEGYAFYALYPEQYANAARAWDDAHADAARSPLVVVGIRSIGTSLAALVNRALWNRGRQSRSLTVRPSGHPFARRVNDNSLNIGNAEYALIVDEGPGMSGSSLASVAQALADKGMNPAHIAFLPGHGGDPGGQGNHEVKRWWAIAPRYVTPLHDMRWNGHPLPDALAAHSARMATKDVEVSHIEDFGAGAWRNAVYASQQQWPAVCAAFERPKYRITLDDGTRILWKFAGLATGDDGREQTEAMYRTLTERGAAGGTIAPLGTAMGFVALPWRDGTPLTYADVTLATLRHIGRHIAHVAAPPLSPLEHDAALARLAEMLYWNVWEALGEEHAVRTRAWSDLARHAADLQAAPTYGDGRIAPHEWLRLPDDTLLKTDCGGHDTDHTVVGKQAWLWDVAGALVEWQLEAADAAFLVRSAEEGMAQAIPPDVLTFYRMAYAAFRAGQTHLCAQMSGYDPAEQTRLWQAFENYKEQLRRLLTQDEDARSRL